MTAKPLPSFSEDFKANLTANDQDFAQYLERTSRFLLFAHMVKDNFQPPPGSTFEQEVMKGAADTSNRGMGSRINMVPIPPNTTSAPNNMGLRLRIPMESDGRSVANTGGYSITLTEGMCTSCSGPSAAAKHLSCSDLSDPAQVRGGQLARMMVGLHEVGHNAFQNHVALYGGLPEAERRTSIGNQQMSETMADAIPAILMIKELGPEGLKFLKQYASGFRDRHNGHDADHNTSNALGMLIEAAEADMTSIRALPYQSIYTAAYGLARLATPDNEQHRKLKDAFEKAGLDSNPESPAHPKATARLAWYDAQRKDEQAGKPVDKEALDLYEKFMRHGDRAMMSPQQLQENLQVMVDLGPLKGNTAWQEQAIKEEQMCRATPPATAPLAKPFTAQP